MDVLFVVSPLCGGRPYRWRTIMLTTLSAFASVEHLFAGLVHAPTPHYFDARLIRGVERVLPLDQLRDLLQCEQLDADTTDAVWRQLTGHARHWGEPWTTIATAIAAPGLTRMAGRILRGTGGRFDEDVASEMLTAFLSALRGADLAPPRLWLRLCWTAWRAGVRATHTDATSAQPDDVPSGARSPVRPYGHPDLLLGRAVAAGVIPQQAADLISATRLDHVLLTQLAAEQNVSPVVLRRRRRRWEAQLVDALRQGLLTVIRPANNGPARPHHGPTDRRQRACQGRGQVDADVVTSRTPSETTGAEAAGRPLTSTVRSGQVRSGRPGVHLT
jgi:hypothetical protein